MDKELSNTIIILDGLGLFFISSLVIQFGGFLTFGTGLGAFSILISCFLSSIGNSFGSKFSTNLGSSLEDSAIGSGSGLFTNIGGIMII